MTIQLQPEQIYNSTPKNVDRFGTVATIIMYVSDNCQISILSCYDSKLGLPIKTNQWVNCSRANRFRSITYQFRGQP